MSPKTRNKKDKLVAEWEWNVPLLIKSAIVFAGVGCLTLVLYFWQSSSMASELLSQAKNSEERGQSKDRVKWLSRYVRLVPNDVQSVADLAFAVDSQESGPNQNVEFARNRLAAAIAACGVEPQYEELRTELRRRLVPRLLQFGVAKAAEAQEQIILLKADEKDPQVLNWLAQSLLMQRSAKDFQTPDTKKVNREKDFWNWLLAQPVGQALQMAVEANPDNVDLAQNLLFVFNQKPSWFGNDIDAASQSKIAELAKQTLERLCANRDDGQSQFIAYTNMVDHDPSRARSILESAQKLALERLAEFSNLAISNPADLEKNPKDTYIPFWDWQIALQYANVVGGDESTRIISRLVELSNDRIPLRQREETFVRLARLKLDKDEYEFAIEACKAGLASVKSSVSLNRLIAFAYLRLDRPKEAANAISEIETDTELRRKQLDGAQGIGMTSAEKLEVRQQISEDQWMAHLLRGQLAMVNRDFTNATKLLSDVYKTALPIASENRVEAGLLLATCYSQTREWDLAGQVYDECAILKPSDRSISINAVRAWRQAGSPERASEQVANLDDATFPAALERALLVASKPSSQLDRRGVLNAIKIARQRLDAMPIEEQSAQEPWRLEMLELRFSSDEAEPSKEQQENSLSKLQALAEKYHDVSAVQIQAAQDFTSFGRQEAADLAISRLERIAEASKVDQDKANVELAKVSLRVIKKDTDGALKLIENAISLIPEQELNLAKVGAQIAIRAERTQKAFELLGLVPESKLDFESIIMLAGIADSIGNMDEPTANKATSKLERWIEKTKLEEGEEGTNWRYLAAERLVAKIAAPEKQLAVNIDEANDRKLLAQAAAYYKEIDARRPQWGLASSLGAKIASFRAKMDRNTNASEEAISLWRRAIRDGDNRVSTVLDLVQELNMMDRGDLAEIELQRVSTLADSVVPVSAMAVSFAMKRGDFSEARARAEQVTIRQPEEVNGWLLRAQTAFAASGMPGLDESAKAQLQKESWEHLEKANGLAQGRKVNVWDARFRYKVLTGDKAGASSLLEEMSNAPTLTEEVRFMEAGRRYLLLKEYGLARKCFDNCLLVNNRSADAHLALADLNAAIGDNEASLNSLRKAQQLSPRNQAIRDRLAINLAFSRNEKTENLDWKEIDALLTGGNERATPRSTIVGALIALSRGDKDRQLKAVRTLKDISQSAVQERNDAKRLLANYFALQWSMNSKDNQAEKAAENFEFAKRLYEELLEDSASTPNDAARFVSLLISCAVNSKEKQISTKEDYLKIAERILTKLETSTGSSIATLQLRIQLANASGQKASVGSIAEKWVEDAGDLETLGMQNLWEITGETLMQLGHSEESIEWLEKVYEKDPKKYGLLVIALAREKKYQRAIELCVKAFQAESSPIAATLLAEVAMMDSEINLQPDALQVIKEALATYSESAELLEALGTLELMKRHLPEAVSFFERAEKEDPKRRRTLNNLAMALSEMPMRQPEALAKIEKAIEIFGRDPDLLDTLGQVQYRNGRVQEGLATLVEACQRKEDVSFRIHIAQILVDKNDLVAAKEQWTKIKQSKLEGVLLTPQENDVLAKLNSLFEGKQ